MTAPHIGNTGVNDEDPESRADLGRRLRRPRPRPASRPTGARGARLDDELRDAGRRRHQRHRHPRPDPAPARARRDAGRHLHAPRPTRTRCSSRVLASPPRWPAPTWPPRSPPREPYVVPAVGEKRFTVAALDLGIKANDAAADGRARHRGARAARDRDARRRARGRRRRGVLLQRPGRPGRPPTAQVELLRGVLERGHPVLRHLLRQPALRPGARLRHLQAEVRPPRHQPAGAWTAPPARSRSPRTTTASPSTRRSTRRPTTPYGARRRSATSASTTTSSRGSSCAATARCGVLRAVPPRGGGRPARRRLPVRPVRRPDGAADEGRRLMPKRDRHPAASW